MKRWCLCAVLVAVCMLVGIASAIGGGGGENTTAHPVTPTAAAPSYPVQIPSVAPGAAPMVKRPCPDDWQRISDDALMYSFCVPPDWWLMDPQTRQPRVGAVLHWEHAAIFSPDALPFPADESADELLRDSNANIIYMQLIPLRADMTQNICELEPADMAGALPSTRCEYRYDYLPQSDWAQTAPEGEWGGLLVVVPLSAASPEPGVEGSAFPTPEGGYSYGLGILFNGRNEALAHYHDLIYQILGTLDGQP